MTTSNQYKYLCESIANLLIPTIDNAMSHEILYDYAEMCEYAIDELIDFMIDNPGYTLPRSVGQLIATMEAIDAWEVFTMIPQIKANLERLT